MIRFQNLTKSYPVGDTLKVVIDDLSLTLTIDDLTKLQSINDPISVEEVVVEPGPAASIMSPMMEVPPTVWPSRVT